MKASVELLVNLDEQDTPLFNTLPITSISKHSINVLIHIDVLMLCSKFEAILTSIFQVMAILKNGPILEKIPVLLPMVFFQKMALKSPQIFITFSNTY